MLQSLQNRWTANVALKDRIRDLAKTGQQAEAVQVLNKEETPSWRDIKDTLLKRSEEQAQAVETSKKAVADEASGGTMLSVVAFIGAFAIAMIMVTTTIARIRRPLLNLENSMCQLESGDGDLTRRLPVETHDEVGRTATSFNNFIGSLQGTIGNVQTNDQGGERIGATGDDGRICLAGFGPAIGSGRGHRRRHRAVDHEHRIGVGLGAGGQGNL